MLRSFKWIFTLSVSRRLIFAQSLLQVVRPKLFIRVQHYCSAEGKEGFCRKKDLKEHWLKKLREKNVPEAELSLRYIFEHVLRSYKRDLKVKLLSAHWQGNV